MQYNVEWLFTDYYKNMDCYGNGCTWHTYDDAVTHMTYVSNTINTLQPDIINFCEVQGINELNQLSDMLLLGNEYSPYFIQGTDTGTGQNVAMLSKLVPQIPLYRSEEKVAYPIDGSMCGSEKNGTTGVSKHYITEFNMFGLNVAVIGAHLLAIPTDPDRCAQREGQAIVLQNMVTFYVDKGYEVILIGDMNDYDNDISDVNDNKPTSRVLSILKGNYLSNVAVNINKEDRYSDWWDSDNNCNTTLDSDWSMIDHILVTKGIEKYIQNTFIYHGYKEYCGKWNSDHYPVVIDILSK